MMLLFCSLPWLYREDFMVRWVCGNVTALVQNGRLDRKFVIVLWLEDQQHTGQLGPLRQCCWKSHRGHSRKLSRFRVAGDCRMRLCDLSVYSIQHSCSVNLQLIHKSFWFHLFTYVESDISELIRRNVGTMVTCALTRPRETLETFCFEGESAE